VIEDSNNNVGLSFYEVRVFLGNSPSPFFQQAYQFSGSGTIDLLAATPYNPVSGPVNTPLVAANTFWGGPAAGPPTAPAFRTISPGSVVLSANNAWTGNETHTGTETFAGITGTGTTGTLGLGPTALAANNAFTGAISVKSVESVLYVDPANSQGWVGGDFGAWVNSAIATLPTNVIGGHTYRRGKIVIAPGEYTQSTTIVPGAMVLIEGAGHEQTRITYSGSGDAFNVRDNSGSGGGTGFNGIRCAGVGGFTLVGPGGSTNANGIHTGDFNFGRFWDMAIGNFTGATSSGFWVDNQFGWFERNLIQHINLGEYNTATAYADPGNTMCLRFTLNGGTNSFGYNTFQSLRFSPITPQIAISLEADTLYNCFIEGSGNFQTGCTLFKISDPGALGYTQAGTGNWLDIRAEGTGSLTLWNVSAGVYLGYMGPGLVVNGNTVWTNTFATGAYVYRSLEDGDFLNQNPTAAGATKLWLSGNGVVGTPHINELISVDTFAVNSGGGFGSRTGSSIIIPMVWSTPGVAASLFEVYKKTFQVPVADAARVAYLPDGIGSATSAFVLTAPPNAQTVSYVAALTDTNNVVTISNGSANTFTIPLNASVAFPLGTVLSCVQLGAGQTTIVAAGGVTLHTPSSLTARAQYSTVSVTKIGTDLWIASGDLT
jgi:hypothetical protein